MWFPDDFVRLAAFSELVTRWLRRWREAARTTGVLAKRFHRVPHRPRKSPTEHTV
jgi:hypothetical protein